MKSPSLPSDKTSAVQYHAPRSIYLVALVLAFLVGFSVISRYTPYTFIKKDAAFYATTTRALIGDLSLDQRPWQPVSWYDGTNSKYRNLNMAWSNIAVGWDGTWYPKHSYVMPFFAVPFYLLFGPAGLLVFNALCAFLMLLAAYRIAVEFASPVSGLAAVLLFACGPAFVAHTYQFSLDIFSAMLVAVGAAVLLHFRVVLGGLLLGIALWARPTLVPLVVPLVLVFSWGRLSRRQMVKLGVSLAFPLAAAALANLIMFGAPWITSYSRVLTMVKGVPVIQSHTDCFNVTFEDGIERLFWSVDDGWRYRSPSAFLALAGIYCLWRRARIMAVGLVVAVGGYLAFFLTFDFSSARFFFAWQALLCLPLALLLSDFAGGVRWMARHLRLPRSLQLAAVTAVVVTGAGLMLYLSRSAPGKYVLSQHIEEARVSRNKIPCDYFNMAHGRWECSKFEDEQWEYTGLALRDNQCVFNKQKGPAIWFHPPTGKSIKRLVFQNVPSNGALQLQYGLADSAVSKETCFTVSWGDREPESFCADKAGKILSKRLEGPDDGLVTLEFKIESPPYGKRHLCFDGAIVGLVSK
jgi:hypothetical protein